MTDATGISSLPAALAVAAVHFLAVLSPGPDMAVVLRTSLAFGRKAGTAASAGIGVGNGTHIAYALAGLGLVLTRSQALWTAGCWLASAYLAYLGARVILSSRRSDPAADRGGDNSRPVETWLPLRRHFAVGFFTSALNPKATLFYFAVFTALMAPSATPLPWLVGMSIYMPVATAAIFSAVSCAATAEAAAGFLRRFGPWIDRAMGTVLILLAIQIFLAASEAPR